MDKYAETFAHRSEWPESPRMKAIPTIRSLMLTIEEDQKFSFTIHTHKHMYIYIYIITPVFLAPSHPLN